MAVFTDAFGGAAGFLDSRSGWSLASGAASKAQTNANGRVDLLNTGATGTWSAYTCTAPGSGDHYAQANVGNSANPIPLLVGWDATNKQGYGVRFSANFMALYRLNNGTRTSIAAVNTTSNVSLSDLIRVERETSSGAIRVYRNGVQLGSTVTDTTYSGAGVGMLAASAANATDMVDNWQSGPLGGSTLAASPANMASATVAGAPAATRTRSVAASALASAGSLGTPAASRTRPVAPSGTASASSISAPSSTATRPASPAALASATLIVPPAATRTRPVTPSGTASAASISGPSSTATRPASPAALALAASIVAPAATGARPAQPSNLSSSATLGAPGVLTFRAAIVASLLFTTALTAPDCTRPAGRITMITTAQRALVSCLAAADLDPAFTVTMDQGLSFADVAEALNVVRATRPPDVLDVQMGLGEDNPLTEFVQTFNIEWVVRGGDADARIDRFESGLLAIERALMSDQTLGGTCRGLTIQPPDFTTHNLATAPETSAVLIPVRVGLQGRSIIA